jgi:hypothetical protein
MLRSSSEAPFPPSDGRWRGILRVSHPIHQPPLAAAGRERIEAVEATVQLKQRRTKLPR